MSAAPAPADPFDAALYAPLPGAAPMGEALAAEVLAALEVPIAANADGARAALEERREQALSALGRTRDLRVYARLAEAQARLEGPRGLHAGLHLLVAVVRGFWDGMHPGPAGDEDADNARRRAFTPFRARDLIAGYEGLTLFDAGGFERRITLRAFWHTADLHGRTRRRQPAADDTVHAPGAMAALVARAEAREAVAAAHLAFAASAALLRELEAMLVARPAFDTLRFTGPTALAPELELFAEALAPFAAAPEAAAAAPEAADDAPPEGPAGPTPSRGAAIGAIADRAAAAALRDALLAWFAAENPSNPVALALLKLRDLEGASFGAWMTALDPENAEEVSLRIADVDPVRLAGFAAAAPPPAPDPGPLAAIEAAAAALVAHQAAREVAEAEIAALAAAVEAARDAAAHARPAPPVVADRAAARQALQRLAAFHKATEPSSPAGLVFDRLVDLVDRKFMDILSRVAPRGPRSSAVKIAP